MLTMGTDITAITSYSMPQLSLEKVTLRFLISYKKWIYLHCIYTKKQQNMAKKSSSNHSQCFYWDTLKSGYNFLDNRSNKVKSIKIKKNWYYIWKPERLNSVSCEVSSISWISCSIEVTSSQSKISVRWCFLGNPYKVSLHKGLLAVRLIPVENHKFLVKKWK